MNFRINQHISIPWSEIQISAIRSQGPGGQNVNKVSTAIQLKFHVESSTLPPEIKELILQSKGHHLTPSGFVLIKAQASRSQESNRQEALGLLKSIILKATHKPKNRFATKPTKASKLKRLKQKKAHSDVKKMRRKNWD